MANDWTAPTRRPGPSAPAARPDQPRPAAQPAPPPTRTTVHSTAATETRRIAATLGGEARITRRRRRRTQEQVSSLVGISRARYAELERGSGEMAPLDLWVRVGLALERPLSVAFSRDIEPAGPQDAGHLAAQELVLRLAAEHGRDGTFELPMGPIDRGRSADICLCDDPDRALGFIEIWNRLDDLGAAVRATDRKADDARVLATIAGGDARPYRVTVGWLLVDTAANRNLVHRYPGILRARFPGPSVGWVRALTDGAPFPDRPAIAWFDPASGRIRPLRLPS